VHVGREVSRFFGFVMVLGFVAMVLAEEEVSPEVQLERELAKLKEAGEPITLADLAPSPIPEEENAAPLYERALAKMVVADDGVFTLRDELFAGGLWDLSAQKVERLREYLSRNSEAIEVLRRAAQKPRCRFDFDYAKVLWGDDVTMREIPGARGGLGSLMREAARTLRAKAMLDKADGKVEQAALDCWVTLRMANALGQEPLIIPQLVRIAIAQIALRGLEFLLYDANVPVHLQAKLLGELSPLKGREALARSLAGERAVAYQRVGPGFVVLAMTAEPETLPRPYLDWSTTQDSVARDNLNYLRWSSALISAAREPYSVATVKVNEIAKEVDGEQFSFLSKRRLASCLDGGPYLCQARVDAKAGCLEVVFALKNYNAEHGSYPVSLEELAGKRGELPLDPFNGESFTYRREEGGFLVYSVGRDGKDDGGSEKDDIVWRCVR